MPVYNGHKDLIVLVNSREKALELVKWINSTLKMRGDKSGEQCTAFPSAKFKEKFYVALADFHNIRDQQTIDVIVKKVGNSIIDNKSVGVTFKSGVAHVKESIMKIRRSDMKSIVKEVLNEAVVSDRKKLVLR